MNRSRTIVGAVALAHFLFVVTASQGYAPGTHAEIGATAVERSDLDSILKNQFGIDQGAAVLVSGRTVGAWVGIGATREDFPGLRSLNHFHNPLAEWPDAGGLFGMSSIYWQQSLDQGLGGTWSWPIARQRLLDFLTLPGPAARQQALADTVRALGQVMHMIQDAASPAHTRDDPHVIHDGYEARIEELRASADAGLRSRVRALLAAPSILPVTSIFAVTDDAQATDDARAPAPVARLIDTNKYLGTVQSYSVGAHAGLAEYTNGGYLSDDTIFRGFALPRRESLGPGVFDPPVGLPGARRYFPKLADGDIVGRFVAEGALYERLLFRGQLVGGFVLDDRVYEDYAAQLVPRAVGYSAGLLNYFFRSNFDFTVDVSTGDPSKRRLTVTIPPDPAAETMDGTFTLYAEDKDGMRSPVAGASITTTLPRGALAQSVFTPVSGVRAYVLAFQGTLGNEPGAVTGKVRPVGPVVSALQATAEFTGEEQRITTTEVDNASTLIVVERRSKDERQQRARGTFLSDATSTSSQHLKRVSLEFDPRLIGVPSARLLLDDIDVGQSWSRGASVVEDPSRWEIRVDLPALFGGGIGGVLVPNVPRFLVVETVGGIVMRAPLLWWRSASSLAEARGGRETATACPPDLQCEEVISTSTIVNGLVFFGDGNAEGRDALPSGQRLPLSALHTSVGFTPVGLVAGYGVGTVGQSGSLNCFEGCTTGASCSTSTVAVFAEPTPAGPVWAKDKVSVSLASLTGVRRPANACVRPAAGQPVAPDLPAVRFRRDYLPAEQSRFQEFGVTPPEYEIILR
jgi:hypothetical protein